eukprot:scaffold41654_cov37-Phaeocystis_antarctica.AAC.2
MFMYLLDSLDLTRLTVDATRVHGLGVERADGLLVVGGEEQTLDALLLCAARARGGATWREGAVGWRKGAAAAAAACTRAAPGRPPRGLLPMSAPPYATRRGARPMLSHLQ